MNTKSKQIRNFTCLLFVSLILNIGMAIHIGHHHSNPDTIVKTETITKILKDTVIHIKYETDTFYVKEYIDRGIIDTVYVSDSTTLYNYKDSIINIKMLANKVEWLKYDINKMDTVTLYETIKQPIYIKKKKPLLNWGIGIYTGYSPIYNKIDVIVGGGLQINF